MARPKWSLLFVLLATSIARAGDVHQDVTSLRALVPAKLGRFTLRGVRLARAGAAYGTIQKGEVTDLDAYYGPNDAITPTKGQPLVAIRTSRPEALRCVSPRVNDEKPIVLHVLGSADPPERCGGSGLEKVKLGSVCGSLAVNGGEEARRMGKYDIYWDVPGFVASLTFGASLARMPNARREAVEAARAAAEWTVAVRKGTASPASAEAQRAAEQEAERYYESLPQPQTCWPND